MRIRLSLMLACTLVLAAFVTLNWPEFVRPTTVSLGVTLVDVPLPLVLLAGLLLVLLAGMGHAVLHGARLERERSLHMRELQAQRNLADKAEASRFTELRLHLDLQADQNRQHETALAEALQATLVKGQRDLLARLEGLSQQLGSQPTVLPGPERTGTGAQTPSGL